VRRLSILLSVVLLLSLGNTAFAQTDSRPPNQPIYKITINVVERTTKAINYLHRNGATTIDFRGTPLLPEAKGEAKVESKQGYIEIEVEFDELQPANRFGPEYTTYVMWAITPEGRATNLGEVILNGTESKLDVTSELQAFGLIVTAEPYFAVSQPSDVVVMENFIRTDTRGKVEEIDAKYELLQRGQYSVNVPPAELKAIVLDPKIPLDLFEARNAVRIAQWAGADKDAADSYTKAAALLRQAEDYQRRNAGKKPVSMTAREAVQTAEDARLIALKRQDEARLESERRAAADREAQAKAAADRARLQAEAEAQRRAQAEQDQKLEAERRARAEAETAATQAQARADAALAKLEADRAAQQAALDRANIQAEADRAAQQAALDRANIQAEADRAAQQAALERANIQAEADKAREAAAKAEQEKQELRQRLVQQLNLILQTRDSARGLIVNMSDVLFDTGKFTLKPGAREKLAKVAGIVLANPGLSLQVEGHTDSVGSDDYNQKLSENRAGSVRDFLVQQGIRSEMITAKGMGEAYPVTTNDTATGRQQNRRVEMIVSGDVIGVSIGPQTSNPR